MSTPVYEIRAVEIGQRPVALALPFHFGDVTVTETAEAYLRVTLAVDGRDATGVAAQLMVPRWFDKRPSRTATQTVDDLRDTLRTTRSLATGRTGSIRRLSLDIRTAVRTGDTPSHMRTKMVKKPPQIFVTTPE